MKFTDFLVLGSLFASAAGEVYFKETFSDENWEDRWVTSDWKAGQMGKWELTSGKWNVNPEIEQGLRTAQDAKFYGISSKLEKPFSNRGQDLVVQFSVKNEDKQSSFCGGGYIKLLGSDIDQKKFGGETPYKIMFGPDLCGYDVSRIHLIFNHKDKNLLKKEDIKLDYDEKNEFTHLYTLHLKPDNTFTVYLDQKEKATGNLIDGWDFPKKTIDDPEDKKPEDWVDEKKIPDPDDKKPEGWDEIPEMIPDPEAEKPDDWDNEDDGEWEPPMIPNPEYKGEWKPKMIPNPAYKGEWKAKQLDNPEYDENVYAYDDFGAVGFELWVVNSGSIFDNIFIGNSLEEARQFAKETFEVTKEGEKEAKKKFDDEKKAASKSETTDNEEEESDDDDAIEPEEKEEL